MHGHQFAGGGMFRDQETFEIIDVEYLKQCFYELAALLEFIQNIETGMITVSLTEYSNLPAVALVAWRTYKREKEKKQLKENERLKAQYGSR